MDETVIDLFCGVGGLSLGFQQAGLPVRAAYDNWEAAVEVYRLNMDHPADCIDLSDLPPAIKMIKQEDPTLLIGGPPCQDFSSAGKRTEGNNANLTEAFALIAAECRPKAVVMENVPRIRSSKAYATARSIMSSSGYSFFEAILDASLFGVPQIRKRFFSVAWVGRDLGKSEELQRYFDSRAASERLTVADYLAEEITIEHYYRHPRNYSRRAVFSIYEPSPTIRGVNRPVPPNYKGNHLDSAPVSDVRPLTSYERSRIQTFPKSWKWKRLDQPIPKTDLELLIGNAVPVNLASFVAGGVKEVVL